MATLTTPTSTIHYEEYGSGYPALLFAPGFLSSRIERWRTNPSKPGVDQAWSDPIPLLSTRFRVVVLDVRNAGRSRGAIAADDGWHTYTADHLALLDHLGIGRCHLMGACIGVSFALALERTRPGTASAFVLQNPIGLAGGNRAAIEQEFDDWARKVAGWPGVDAALLPGIGRRMFGGEFLFSVTREDVAACDAPMFLMPGGDTVHPAETSADIAKHGRDVEVMSPWKGPDHRDEAVRRVFDFLVANTPAG